MISIFLGLAIIILLYFYDKVAYRNLYKLTKKFPGPRALPIIGNSWNFINDSHGIFVTILKFSEKYGRFYRLWNGGKFYVMCADYKDAETILGNTEHLTKSESYRFIQPWIGLGVLTSTGSLWKKHRKIITPAFHFRILQEFVEVFNRKAVIFCEKLAEKDGLEEFDIYYDVKLLALDNIYETSMGMNMDVQKNSDSAYVRAVNDMCSTATLRFFQVWLMVDIFFKMSKYWKIQKKALDILHRTTEAVIKTKSQETSNSNIQIGDTMNKQKYESFIDLIMKFQSSAEMSQKEIREEIDTFLFAGHDTVSSGISFALYCLANNPEVQEKAYQEQIQIFGDSERLPTSEDLQEMKYLERVIKEAQRLYPSVPIVGRGLMKPLELRDGIIVPDGTQINVMIYCIHRDPRIWKNPEQFNPDNFLPDAIKARPPYTYIPFSAGPRNCIGQKYAMLEMKAIIGIILRKYKILPSLLEKNKLRLAAEIILVSKTGIHLRVESRR